MKSVLLAGMLAIVLVFVRSPTLAVAQGAQEWFPFAPATDVASNDEITLRFLNEKFAGEQGRIGAKNGTFIHRSTGEPVRFWAVNGPPEDLKGDDLRRCAKLLAAYGVNLVRVHGAVFDRTTGELDPAKIQHAHEIVAAMKAEGIYTHFSIYFPLWFTPAADLAWLPGYNGKQHPFAALQFNPQFQEKHRGWLTALLTTPDPTTGKRLLDEPAVFGVELQNEDSFFFWTFDARNIPDAQLTILEKLFGDWLIKRHGSLDKALANWGGAKLERDVPEAGRLGFRPLWNIAHEKTKRDQETAQFLLETQTAFYQSGYDHLRKIGFEGLIHGSNWATADPEVFGPLEKLSYTFGDFVDRHGYFECNHKGDNAAWSIRPGHTYSDRSALRFDAGTPGKPKQFVHPVMDPHYDDKPSMISETTFTRPNRYRSEAPLYFACYGALQESDCIVHFAFDGAKWEVKPRFWMQQWTLATPAMLGQFPAAALIYRQGLVAAGDVLANVKLNKQDVLNLKGTPLPQDASLDELRLADVPLGQDRKPGERISSLLHFAGRAHVEFTDSPGSVTTSDLRPLINLEQKTVTSSTGELTLNYADGLLVINSPKAQGASGNLQAGGTIRCRDLTLSSDMDLLNVVAVPLDGKPLATSQKILLQVMSEEQATGFQTEAVDDSTRRITNIGTDPWRVKSLRGNVSFTRSDAASLRVVALDANGRRGKPAGNAATITLRPNVMYYLITP